MIIDPQKLIELVDLIKAKDAEIDRLRGVLASADRWIIQRGRDLPDHACSECVPGGEMVVPGWLCAYHAAKARAALAAKARAALADGEGAGK